MSDIAKKALQYIKVKYDYWQMTEEWEQSDHSKVAHYPLDFRQRIEQAHYHYFDANGIPVLKIEADGTVHYLSTRACGFALGKYSEYLNGRNVEENLHIVGAIAEFLAGFYDGKEVLCRTKDSHGNTYGEISSMSQGEAMSVLVRQYLITREERYMTLALACVPAFNRPTTQIGVGSKLPRTEVVWYEEYPKAPIYHVLNGMIYSLIGLHELHAITGDKKVNSLLDQGLDSVKKGLPAFDTGTWSYYWVPENGKNYIASIMYHNLHICQLEILHRISGITEFRTYADRFRGYYDSNWCRTLAATSMLYYKAVRRSDH